MLRLFDFRCNKCGNETEKLIRVLDDGCETVMCPKCEGRMDRLPPSFRINMGPVPIVGYYDDNLQTYIRTNTHRREVMERQGVTEKGATPKGGRHQDLRQMP
jgi:putative FmdB family regulatory protein